MAEPNGDGAVFGGLLRDALRPYALPAPEVQVGWDDRLALWRFTVILSSGRYCTTAVGAEWIRNWAEPLRDLAAGVAARMAKELDADG
jgi:hypothetical protein